jgi:hypothetical protein
MKITMDQFQALVGWAIERLQDESFSGDKETLEAGRAMCNQVTKLGRQAESATFVLVTREDFQGNAAIAETLSELIANNLRDDTAEEVGLIAQLAREKSQGTWGPVNTLRDPDAAPDDRADAIKTCLLAYVCIVGYGREISENYERTAFVERVAYELRRYLSDLQADLESAGVSRQNVQDAVQAHAPRNTR